MDIMQENGMKGRVLLAGTGSGTGKTTITCGIIKYLMERGWNVSSFKCGPDYLDPMLHRRILGQHSYNLDSLFLDENQLKKHFIRCTCGSDYCIMEGVMGYYDGAGFSFKGSTYEIASLTDTPVILIINGRGLANTIGAVLKGFLSYVEESYIRGVIVNQVSEKTYEKMKPIIQENGLIPCGYLNILKDDLILENRHLGLVTEDCQGIIDEKLEKICIEVCKTIDMDKVVEIAKGASCWWNTNRKGEGCRESLPEEVCVAVARDEAFSFYYEENLELLKQHGCRLVFFSPIRDEELPKGSCGLILGGGYPELSAGKLSQNTSMQNAIRGAVKSGMPVIAECGGYMYLKEALEDLHHEMHAMTGILPGTCKKQKNLVRFGYVSLEALKDNLLCKKGEKLVGHEFHYWDSEENGDAFLSKKIAGKENNEEPPYLCGYVRDTLAAGFTHLYFPANEMAVENFCKKCREYQEHGKGRIL